MCLVVPWGHFYVFFVSRVFRVNAAVRFPSRPPPRVRSPKVGAANQGVLLPRRWASPYHITSHHTSIYFSPEPRDYRSYRESHRKIDQEAFISHQGSGRQQTERPNTNFNHLQRSDSRRQQQ